MFFVPFMISCEHVPKGDTGDSVIENGDGDVGDGNNDNGDNSDAGNNDDVNDDEFSGKAFSVEYPKDIPSLYDGINIEDFINQSTLKGGVQNGIIECPFYEVKFTSAKSKDSSNVFSYSVPLYQQELLSFGYIEATADMLPITVSIKPVYKDYSVFLAKVIPEKLNATPIIDKGTVTFSINNFNSFTVLFQGADGKNISEFNRPYTLFVKQYEEITVPDGFELIEFNAGIHYLDRIVNGSDGIKSNTFIYVHSGAYLVANPIDDSKENSIGVSGEDKIYEIFIKCNGVNNVIVKGGGIIDFSRLHGHARQPFEAKFCTNITLDGITFVGSPGWTCHFFDSVDITVKNCKLLSYRINTDGIAVNNCKDVLIEKNFICSGDDLFEVKSMSTTAKVSGTGGKNITFKDCQAWALKTRAFGFVQESLKDVDGIFFDNCSVLYHKADFTMTDSFTSMGAVVVVVGDSAMIKNVKFGNCGTYDATKYLINIVLADNAWTGSNGCSGKIENVTFENMHFRQKGKGFQIVNKKNNNSLKTDISDIKFNDIYFGEISSAVKVTDFQELCKYITFVGNIDSDCITEFNGNAVGS